PTATSSGPETAGSSPASGSPGTSDMAAMTASSIAPLHDLHPAAPDILADVLAGLATTPKTLPSKYFYDARGSALFEAICGTPEYYLTRAELAIMQRHGSAIAAALGEGVRLVEYGVG